MEVLDKPPVFQISEYSPTAAALAELRSRLENVAYDVSTIKGLDVAKRDRKEVRDLRVALEAKRVELKAPALERSRLIDAEAKALTAELTALEKPIDDQIKAEERRKEVEKAAREQAEREAAAAVQARIDAIRSVAMLPAGMKAEGIALAIDHLTAIETTLAEYGERAGEAAQAKAQTLAKLTELHTAAANHEAEQARVKAEADRLAAERKAFEEEQAAARAEAKAREDADRARRDEEDRIAREARAAEDQRLARERAELEAQQRAMREAEEAKAAAVRKAEQDAADKAAAAERKRLDKIAAAERAEKERQDAERAAKAQAEYDALMAAASALKRLHDAAPAMLDALQMAKHIVVAEGTREQADQVFAAIELATGEPA